MTTIYSMLTSWKNSHAVAKHQTSCYIDRYLYWTFFFSKPFFMAQVCKMYFSFQY